MPGIVTVGVMAQRIAVIDDEQAIAEAVALRLRNEGYEVATASDGLAALDLVAEFDPHLVVLDLMLPGLDGIEVCRRIQEGCRLPVVMLTAKDDETDMLLGLDVGADDYITKPFSPRELVARVRAVLRRVDTPPATSDETIELGAITIEIATRLVRRGDDIVHLTPLEFDLVVCLAHQGGAVLSREDLLAKVWGYDGDYGARTVDSHVRSVRRKLGDDIIRTVHAVGYAIGDVT